MDEKTLGKIKSLIIDAVKPLKEIIEILNHKVDKLETAQTLNSASISMIKNMQSMMNDKLDTHTGALIEIEGTLKGYADSYKTNKSNIERLDVRVSELEDHAEIIPPPELTIQR